ncbi:MAG: uracil-DNA glycosylase [Fimbriiglobus sp.]
MSDEVDISRQVQTHLEALKASGVQFVPNLAPIVTAAPAPVPGQGLFANISTATAPRPTTPEGRRRALETVTGQVKECKACPELASTRTQTVFGIGPIDAEVCFIGEAPGKDEDRIGEPFVGASGQLFNKILAAMGFKRSEVFIMNPVNCHPPDNREPSVVECRNCRGFFEDQLELVKPKLIVCLGGVAARNLLDTTEGIRTLRGQWYEYQGTPVMCSYHPAALLRNPEWKKEAWADMKAVVARLGRELPGS